MSSNWEQPPARVTVGAVIRGGNSRLRWQRGGLVGARALVRSRRCRHRADRRVPFGGNRTAQNPGTAAQAATSGPPAHTGSLPVLRTDASFGWLPAGEKLTSGGESDSYAVMSITAGKSGGESPRVRGAGRTAADLATWLQNVGNTTLSPGLPTLLSPGLPTLEWRYESGMTVCFLVLPDLDWGAAVGRQRV